MKLHDLLNKLEAEETEFAGREILAPVLKGRAVAIKIAGVVCHLKVDDARFQGWAVLQTQGSDKAKILREAARGEIEKYLALLPLVRLVAVARDEDDKTCWHALPAQSGDTRFKIAVRQQVFLCGANAQPFATIIARFDGGRFWFEKIDARRSPALAAYLREQFHGEASPETLNKKGLSAEERAAYAWLWRAAEKTRKQSREEREKARLQNAVAHAEGQLVSYSERGDVYVVTYRVGRSTHTSTVRQDNLAVLTSGICLSGRDRDFDLTSLVGVMREAVSTRQIWEE